MKVGDLFYLCNIPTCKALVTKVFNERKFHPGYGHFNDFPAVSIVPHVKILIVAGKHRGHKEIHSVEDFNRYFRKIDVDDESR